MDWKQLVWFATDNQLARKSLLGSVVLLGIWAVGFGPLVEWRQQALLEQIQPLIEHISEIVVPAPTPGS